ncbi:uncharacterized protein C1orf50 homolog isoform X2 [Athalia rosae]|uniref:uncharacterized protein C1orf50 homolog isoform X2 n=1 Tax=Athalia rosae TaxID=37344 RepID=UPI002033B8D7|nr:uncharacterized protein C1orf50 homolog isoform X2 [Athalia rosae]
MKRSYITMELENYSAIPSSKVRLVERNVVPQGVALVNPSASAKKAPNDLVMLAMEIQKEAKQNTYLHHAACNFRKQPGHVYHIYLRESGQTYFSMLSPEEWGGNGPPHIYKGSYRLEHDHSWTSVSKLEEKDNDLQLIHKILDSNKSFAITDDHNKMNVD